MKYNAQIVTLSAQRLDYGSMPLEPAETRSRSNFPESRVTFSKVRSAKLDTDETILISRHRPFWRKCGNHTITQFREIG